MAKRCHFKKEENLKNAVQSIYDETIWNLDPIWRLVEALDFACTT